MNYLKIIKETTVDGDGIRLALYLSGCEKRCPGCHNPEGWDYNSGQVLTEDVIDEIIRCCNNNPLIYGVSILGGDPFAPKNRAGLFILLEKLYSSGIKNIWVWTGYLYEELKADKTAAGCLNYISVLVDGPYIDSKKQPGLKFRGSSNQRIIRFKETERS